MIRRTLLLIAALALVALVLVSVGLVWAHIEIRGIEPPLPEPAALLRRGSATDLPTASFINTAIQEMPRSAVLDSDLDPAPDRSYAMAHPAFVLEWTDGRILLIDAGMDRESAFAFGKPIERLAGGSPIDPKSPLAHVLGPHVERVKAIAFTHLHADHTQGLLGLCDFTDGPIRVVQTPLQAEHGNYTTAAGRAQIEEAPCARPETLVGEGVFGIPGFPGVSIVPAGGHTPGSQIFVAHATQKIGPVVTWVWAGDIVNQIDGIEYDVPKPTLYSLFVVPEAPARLSALRRFLHELGKSPRTRLIVSHDWELLHLVGIAKWQAPK